MLTLQKNLNFVENNQEEMENDQGIVEIFREILLGKNRNSQGMNWRI